MERVENNCFGYHFLRLESYWYSADLAHTIIYSLKENTMAQLVSSVLGDLVRSSRGIAHSDAFDSTNKFLAANPTGMALI